MSRLCSGHIHDLAEQVKRKGLWRFVRPENTEAFAKRWLAGTATMQEWDPLCISVLEIQKKASDTFGRDFVNGSCPLCVAAKIYRSVRIPGAWIDNITDLMIIQARVNHLIT